METRDQRLARWLDNQPSEIFGWMTVWAQNALPPQVAALSVPNCEEGLFLLTHAFIQAFMESVYGVRGRLATETYLRRFVDGRRKHDRFSLIAPSLHEMRNVMAHQIYSNFTHELVFDYRLNTGWTQQAVGVVINPKIYADRFVDGLERRIQRWQHAVPRLQQIRQKYNYIARWLDLPKADPLTVQVNQLCAAPSLGILRPLERKLRRAFRARYGV